jgi:hypothetical protein
MPELTKVDPNDQDKDQSSCPTASHRIMGMTIKDRLTLGISLAALLVSLAALYFQFFQAKYDLRARMISAPSVNSVSDITGNGALVFSITNAGYRDAVLVGIKVGVEGGIISGPKGKYYLSETGMSLIPADIIGDLPVVLAPGTTILRKFKLNISPELLNTRFSFQYDLIPKNNQGKYKTNLIFMFDSIDAVGNTYTASKKFLTVLWTKKEIVEATFYYDGIKLFDNKGVDWAISAQPASASSHWLPSYTGAE